MGFQIVRDYYNDFVQVPHTRNSLYSPLLFDYHKVVEL